MKTFTDIIISIAAVLAFCAFCIWALNAGAKNQAEYAAANNCRYESGLCYTYEQRGYLFHEKCAADKACREQWGL